MITYTLRFQGYEFNVRDAQALPRPGDVICFSTGDNHHAFYTLEVETVYHYARIFRVFDRDDLACEDYPVVQASVREETEYPRQEI